VGSKHGFTAPRRHRAVLAGLGVALALSLAAPVASAASASATPSRYRVGFPGANGLVVFESARTGKSQIYVRATDGTETAITQGPSDTEPEFNPFGTRIVFQRGDQIYVMNANGSKQKNLSNNQAWNDGAPSWSPDGSKIVFASYEGGPMNIWTMNADGSHRVRLTNDAGGDTNPAWSPDGSKIAFASHRDGNWEVYVMNADGSNQANITNNTADDDRPAWSPDGSTIVFTSGRAHPHSIGQDLWFVSPDGSNLVAFDHHPQGASDGDYATWSPDGSQIVFSANNGLGSYQLWSAPVGGTDTRLTNDAGNPANEMADWQPVAPAPTLTLTPSSGPAGSAVEVTGGGYGPRETVKLTFVQGKTKTKLGSTKANASGAIDKTVTIPATAKLGKATVKAAGVTSALSASAGFTVS
jgi:dipeptidyl aminopeptidase/acylaminoacyl peptidase